MIKKENPLVMFGLVCSCLANAMDEEGLSTENALIVFRRMLQPISKTTEVLEAVTRLEGAGSEVELWKKFQQEAHRAKEGLCPDSLFD